MPKKLTASDAGAEVVAAFNDMDNRIASLEAAIQELHIRLVEAFMEARAANTYSASAPSGATTGIGEIVTAKGAAVTAKDAAITAAPNATSASDSAVAARESAVSAKDTAASASTEAKTKKAE